MASVFVLIDLNGLGGQGMTDSFVSDISDFSITFFEEIYGICVISIYDHCFSFSNFFGSI